MNKDIKLAIFDLDGTLLTPKEVLPEDFEEELKYFNEKGVRVAIASARPATDVFKLFNKVPEGLLISCEDGNVFFEGTNLLSVRYINPEAIDAVYNAVKGRKDIAVLCSSLKKNYITEEDYQKFVATGFKDYVPGGPCELTEDDPIVKVHCACAGGVSMALEVMDTLLLDLQKDFEVHETGRGTIGITMKGANKSGAVKFFMDYLKLDLENIVVFGDSDNDIPMFKAAKYSFAMINALDDVKEAATFVTKENNGNKGAIKALKEFIEQ